MVRILKSDALRLWLLLVFSVFAAGGSGLHHAPVFGIHGCCPDHPVAESRPDTDCPCQSHHAPATSIAESSHNQWTALSVHQCAICQFFATASGSLPVVGFELADVVLLTTLAPAPRIESIDFDGFLARGPPAC